MQVVISENRGARPLRERADPGRDGRNSTHKTLIKTQFKQDLYQDFHDLVMLQLNSSKNAIIDEIAMQAAFRVQFQRNPKEIELVQLHTRSRTYT